MIWTMFTFSFAMHIHRRLMIIRHSYWPKSVFILLQHSEIMWFSPQAIPMYFSKTISLCLISILWSIERSMNNKLSSSGAFIYSNQIRKFVNNEVAKMIIDGTENMNWFSVDLIQSIIILIQIFIRFPNLLLEI